MVAAQELRVHDVIAGKGALRLPARGAPWTAAALSRDGSRLLTIDAAGAAAVSGGAPKFRHP